MDMNSPDPQARDILTRLRDDCYECQQEAADEIERLRQQVKNLEHAIGEASIMLCDWDGYYNADTATGNATKLAELIEDAYTCLQGKSWRDTHGFHGDPV